MRLNTVGRGDTYFNKISDMLYPGALIGMESLEQFVYLGLLSTCNSYAMYGLDWYGTVDPIINDPNTICPVVALR